MQHALGLNNNFYLMCMYMKSFTNYLFHIREPELTYQRNVRCDIIITGGLDNSAVFDSFLVYWL